MLFQTDNIRPAWKDLVFFDSPELATSLDAEEMAVHIRKLEQMLSRLSNVNPNNLNHDEGEMFWVEEHKSENGYSVFYYVTLYFVPVKRNIKKTGWEYQTEKSAALIFATELTKDQIPQEFDNRWT